MSTNATPRPDRYVVARTPDDQVQPTGEPGDTGESWEVWDTTTDTCLGDYYDVASARAERDRLEAEHLAESTRAAA
jgi:hypothetical protein